MSLLFEFSNNKISLKFFKYALIKYFLEHIKHECTCKNKEWTICTVYKKQVEHWFIKFTIVDIYKLVQKD